METVVTLIVYAFLSLTTTFSPATGHVTAHVQGNDTSVIVTVVQDAHTITTSAA